MWLIHGTGRYILTYIYTECTYTTVQCMQTPNPLECTDIGTYTGLVCLAPLPKPQTLFTILVNYAYACQLCYVTNTTYFPPTSTLFRLRFLYDPPAHQVHRPVSIKFLYIIFKMHLHCQKGTCTILLCTERTEIPQKEEFRSLKISFGVEFRFVINSL